MLILLDLSGSFMSFPVFSEINYKFLCKYYEFLRFDQVVVY